MRMESTIWVKLGLVLGLLCPLGQSQAGIWQDRVGAANVPSYPSLGRLLAVDRDSLQQALLAAPLEMTASRGATLELPMPDGSMQRFEVENSPIMAPQLAARYPEIQTYRVRGIDDPTASGRVDMTPAGFHAMISNSHGTLLIDPDAAQNYQSIYARDYKLAAKDMADGASPYTCLVDTAPEESPSYSSSLAFRTSAGRRVYRLAVAATGEYTTFHGGTISLALSAMVTAINRVNQIYGRDLAIQFELVANNDKIIYTNLLTDPYTNDDGAQMLAENQANLDAVIGAANYDIGHVFSTGGGGIAVVGSGCQASIKGMGVTGSPRPIGDIFTIDLVSHELGHQLAAVHSFNGTTLNCVSPNRSEDSAVEPGSGSTIMGYAGICGAENLQLASDAVFHAWSMREIVTFTSAGAGSTCGVLEATSNTAPIVSAGADYSIPKNTPFALQGSATDSEGDTFSYQWDEMDPGGSLFATDASTLGTDIQGNPLFRSFLPVNTPVRVFPRFTNLLAGINDMGEVLPSLQRTMNFRLTARDGKSGVGEDDMQINVIDTAGPFTITEPVVNNLAQGQSLQLNWNVAGTTDAPISCSEVDIDLLAFNSDKSSYCETSLAKGVPNNGSFSTAVPSGAGTASGRIRLKCSTNIFFDINNSDIAINASTQMNTNCISTDGTLLLQGTVFNDAGSNLTTTTPPPPTSSGGGGGGLSWLVLLLGSGWLSGRVLPVTGRRPC